jgi:tetratricopeptide (TPR) repeat protein
VLRAIVLIIDVLAAAQVRATTLAPNDRAPLANLPGPVINSPELSSPTTLAPDKGDLPGTAPELLVPSPAPSASAVAISLDLAVKRGLWSKACGIATDTLARQEAEIEALKVFAICSALVNNTQATETALLRLRNIEGASSHDVLLIDGIVRLRAGSVEQAITQFNSILQAHPDDPLALYFLGTAFRTEKRTEEAISIFQKLLRQWPDHAPALIAIAGITAGPNAKIEDLRKAIVLTKHATQMEPMNLAYWKKLAELYDRIGDHDRASAIKLQWISALKAGHPSVGLSKSTARQK